MYLPHLEKLSRMRLEDILTDENLVERSRLEEISAEHDATGRTLCGLIVEAGVLSDYEMAKLVVGHYALPFLDLSSFSLRREAIGLLPLEMCVKYEVLPLDQFGDAIALAVVEMPSPELIAQLVERTKLTPFLYIVCRRPLLDILEEERRRGAGREAKGAATPAASAAAVSSPKAPSSAPPTPVAAPKAPQAAKPASAPPAAKVVPASAALRWMDTAAKSPDADPQRPVLSPKVELPGRPLAGTSAPAAAGPATPIAAAKAAVEKNWQKIFDLAEESVNRQKPH